jgi:acetate kinase
MSSYILAINCGSSSIKSKLFLVPDNKDEALKAVADVTVKNIGSKGDKVKFKISWEDAEGTGKLGKDLEEDGEAGDAVECERQGGIYLSVSSR